jgi:hypothetical protein
MSNLPKITSPERILQKSTEYVNVNEYRLRVQLGSGAIDSDTALPVKGVYNSTLPTLSDGEQVIFQTDSRGRLIVYTEGDIQIGAIEIKDSGSENRTMVASASAVKTTSTNVLVVQHVDSYGVVGGFQGNVASGAIDAGNPVKIGGVYFATPPTLTEGQRGDAQLDENGNLRVALSSDIEIGAVELKDATTDARAFIKDASGSVTTSSKALLVQTVDGSGSINTIQGFAGNGVQALGNPVRIGGVYNSTSQTFPSGSITDLQTDVRGNLKVSVAKFPNAAGTQVYSNAFGDFTATPTVGTKDIVVSGLPFTLDVINVVGGKISQIASGGAINHCPITGITVSSGTITCNDVGNNFATGDTVFVSLLGPDKAYDSALDVTKTIEQAPVWSRYTDPETLITAAQSMTTSWADLGSEIDCRGYNSLGAWLTVASGSSNDFRVRVLAKHTYAGSEEYNIPIRTVSASDVKIEPEYVEFNVDQNQLMVVAWDTDNIIPYTQLQISCSATGSVSGQVTAAYITKGWK